MTTQSEYVIPCLCGATIRAHERETQCPACGRVLVMEWGREPQTMTCEEAGE